MNSSGDSVEIFFDASAEEVDPDSSVDVPIITIDFFMSEGSHDIIVIFIIS